MGCWNETCAVSKMTIYAGESVRFLPIVQNAWHFEEQGGFPNEESPCLLKGNSGVYISDLWVPFCLPLRGEYNDYGSIENIPGKTEQDKAELSQFIEAFKKNAICLDVGENTCHDVAIKDFTLEEILEALQEGRVYTNYRGAGKDIILTVSWMLIKESVWQSLLSTDILKTDEGSFYKARLSRGDTEDTITRKGILAAIKKQIGKTKTREKIMQKYKETKSDDTKKQLEVAKEMLEPLSGFDGFGGAYRTHIWHHSPSYCPDITDDLAELFADSEYASSIMSLLRINYAPSCGSGSQTDNHKLWKDTFTKWKKIAHKDQHRWDE